MDRCLISQALKAGFSSWSSLSAPLHLCLLSARLEDNEMNDIRLISKALLAFKTLQWPVSQGTDPKTRTTAFDNALSQVTLCFLTKMKESLSIKKKRIRKKSIWKETFTCSVSHFQFLVSRGWGSQGRESSLRNNVTCSHDYILHKKSSLALVIEMACVFSQ